MRLPQARHGLKPLGNKLFTEQPGHNHSAHVLSSLLEMDVDGAKNEQLPVDPPPMHTVVVTADQGASTASASMTSTTGSDGA